MFVSPAVPALTCIKEGFEQFDLAQSAGQSGG
jgi:hypothetical protein